MKHELVFEDTDEGFQCDEKESVLADMARLGRKGIPVGCRGGGCGVCKVQIISGSYMSCTMSRQHISVEDESLGIVLACRIYPRSRITLRVVGKMRKSVYAGSTAPASIDIESRP
ncbi:2Fe-2S iron-sulfur cluster binding domain-containing protein [Pseudomonas aeruginosa]|nr:2Fe-2S iron-sulfur cluster binding domain-containing protein [Pseudomonas aeruginosa]HCF1525223.1 2Fe-2S iron-sulfur cluster binding domain-containing protein [Pseudomonas aeruginosa]